MQEAEILFRISQIVSTTDNFSRAVEQIRSLLELVLGAQALRLELSGTSLEPRLRSPTTAPLRAGGIELGKLLVQGAVPRRVCNYLGEQLGMLLERTRLGRNQSRLEAELAALREDLATRKTVQRAQGILVTRRGLTPASAKLWMSQQARLARLTVQQVAEQVIAGENAQRENSFTPARHRRIA
jgi:hypothetical protein